MKETENRRSFLAFTVSPFRRFPDSYFPFYSQEGMGQGDSALRILHSVGGPMRIRTQFIITMLLFGILVVIIATSAIITNQQIEKASEQEKIASSIAQGASELSYLSNDYLIYRESQQLKRWQSGFASFSNQVASLNVDKPEQQVLVRNIKTNEQRLKQVFDSVASAVGGPSQNRSTALDLAFLQVSWSRMAVQSQGLVSDASRLSQLLHQQMDRLTETRTVLIYVMVGLFGAFLLISYMLTYRRILKSLARLQAGAAVIGSGNFDFKIEEKKNDEIGDLSRSFNRMTADLKAVTASKADLEREVTQRKQAEEDLRQQREWLGVTLSSIGDAVIASDTQGRITFLNPVAVTLTGWQLEETLGQPVQNVFRIVNEKTHAPAEDLVARVLNGKRMVALANDTALVTKDGREVPIEDSAAPIKDSAGNAIGVVLVFHDVTEKRRSQAALRESEGRFRAVFESSSDCILVWDRQYNYLYANQAAIDHVRTTRDKVIGKNIRDGLGHLPDFMHLWMARVDRAFATGESFRVEDAVPVGDRLVHSESQVSPIRDAEGQVFAVGVVYRDITERKRAEAALREAHERSAWLARFPDENPSPVLRVSAEGPVLYCNPASAELSEWACEVGQPLPDALLPFVRQALMEGQEVQQDVQLGEKFYFVSVTPFLGERYANVYGHDITERKQAEDALRESEARLNRSQEIAHLGSWELDLVNNRLTWSDEVYRIFGLQPQEFGATYEAFLEVVHPDDRAAVDAAYSGSVREGRDTYEIEHRVVRKSAGEIRIVHERCAHIRDASRRIIQSVGMVHDITERKQAEDALKQRTLELQQLTEALEQRVQERTEELEALNEALRNQIDECQRIETDLRKSQTELRHLSMALLNAQERERKMVAGEIHDSIGASLAAIKFKAENALAEVADKSPETTTVLQSLIPIVHGAIEEARRIQMSLRPSILDDLGILMTINWFCRQFESTYSNIHIRKEIDIEEHEVPDPLKIVIYRVMQEALNNIAKHSKAPVVSLFLRKTGQAIELVIRDSGQGFDLSEAQSRVGAGRGLGLDSMRERTELSGGSFSIESNKGEGTSIRASWPL